MLDRRGPTALSATRRAAIPLNGLVPDLDPLLERIGDASLVLLGEASHGTHEFYRTRAEITRRLIEEKGFTAVAAEADWPDAWRVDRFVRGRDPVADDGTAGALRRAAEHALAGFERLPVLHFDRSRAVEPLERVGTPPEESEEVPETWPSGV